MDITADVVKKRIAQLRQERETALAQVHGYDGAIQDAEWFLQQVEAEVDGAVEGV